MNRLLRSGRVVVTVVGTVALLCGGIFTAHGAAFRLDYDSLQIDTATLSGGGYQMEAGLGTISAAETADVLPDAVAEESGGGGTQGGGGGSGTESGESQGGGGGRRQSSIASVISSPDADPVVWPGGNASSIRRPAISSARSVASVQSSVRHAAASERSVASAAFSSRLADTVPASPPTGPGSSASPEASGDGPSSPADTAAGAVALGGVTMTEAAVLARLAWIARLKALYGAIPAFLS